MAGYGAALRRFGTLTANHEKELILMIFDTILIQLSVLFENLKIRWTACPEQFDSHSLFVTPGNLTPAYNVLAVHVRQGDCNDFSDG